MKKEDIDANSLGHTKWNCKCRIMFAPKYRRSAFSRKPDHEIREVLRQLCRWNGSRDNS